MNATILPNNEKHYPVLLDEILSIISPQNGGTFIDCTFGQGGYSKEILSYKRANVIALDRDKDCRKVAEKISQNYLDRFIFKNKKFSQLEDLKLRHENIKGIIFDLGYSYTQIKDPTKGLSFKSTGELNMKMGLNDFSAHDVINKLKKEELEKIFYFFGEEKEAKKIAFQIVKERSKKKIDTQGLVELIDRTKKFKNYKIHAATKTFQALRIFVNHEISELIQGLISASKILKKDGVLAVVTFHSLEDKIVKHFFKSLSSNKSISRYLPKLDQPEVLFMMNQKKPILPSISEIKKNVPSRSAKLRYVIKKENFYQFDTDIKEKFSHLIDIENFGKNL